MEADKMDIRIHGTREGLKMTAKDGKVITGENLTKIISLCIYMIAEGYAERGRDIEDCKTAIFNFFEKQLNMCINLAYGKNDKIQ